MCLLFFDNSIGGLCGKVCGFETRWNDFRSGEKAFRRSIYGELWESDGKADAGFSLWNFSYFARRGVSCEYIGDFEDKAAEKQMMEHLYKGKPIIIETSRMRRKGKESFTFLIKICDPIIR